LYRVEEAARTVDVPDFPARTLREEQLNRRHPSPGGAPRHFLAVVGDEPVGHLGLDLPQLDNTHLLEVDLTSTRTTAGAASAGSCTSSRSTTPANMTAMS